MRLTLIRSKKRRSGQTATEYALILGGVSLVLFMLFKSTIRNSVQQGMGLLGGKLVNGIAGNEVQ